MAKEKPVRQARLTYFSSKKQLVCPICSCNVPKEEILSGSGRLIAGELTDELHRTYEKTQKFGYVYPLMYSVIVCPQCFYATMSYDFEVTPKAESLELIRSKTTERKNHLLNLFPSLNFNDIRSLREGIASYLLALQCYELLSKDFAPTYKQGLCCLRAAWLCNDFHEQEPQEHYDYLALIMYRKASFYYRKAVELEESGEEAFSKVGYLGPDQDNNFGFEGVQYLAGLLEFRYGDRTHKNIRIKTLAASRSSISKIVGMGKSSKAKPTAILEFARSLYEQIRAEQGNLEEELA